MKRFFVIGLQIFGFSFANSAMETGKPIEITSLSEPNGYFDLVFSILKYEQTKSEQRIDVHGIFEGKNVGFKLVMGNNWKPGNMAGIQTFGGMIQLESIGEESDNLIAAISKLYKTKSKPKKFVSNIKLTCISLEGNPGKLKNGSVKSKVFHEDENEDRYFEAFLNIDLKSKQVWLNEKDESYREPIVSVLGK